LAASEDEPIIDLRAGGPSVIVLGRSGVAREVVTHTVQAAGRDLIDLAALESTPDATLVAVIVHPVDRDWADLAALDADAIVVLESDDEHEVLDALLRGAEAAITANSEPEDLMRAIEIVGRGGSVLDPTLARQVLHQLRIASADRPGVGLTRRESDILLSIERGESIKQTARTLNISVKTVQNVQSRLFSKLGARNRAQAVARAHELGLLRELNQG